MGEPTVQAPMEVTIGMEKGLAAHPEAVRDALRWLRDHGVTSVETYVLWQDVEREPGRFSFDLFDRDLDLLDSFGLGWVPFLIAGPWYATPAWFRESPESLPARCLEHGRDGGNQSIFNPHLLPRVDTFLHAFADHYRAAPIESVLLGISGDYGEAIHTVHGNWPGEYHGHQGYWCGDDQAVRSWQEHLRRRYGDLTRLNRRWGTRYGTWEEVRPFVRASSPTEEAWLEFVAWYRGTMTAWAEAWLQRARARFPERELYLCTGGDMHPAHGSDFTAQVAAAARYGAGVRITNEGSDLVHNLVLTRLVVTAAHELGGFAGIEPAAAVTPQGVAVRMYQATAAGARQLHEYLGNLMALGPEGAQRHEEACRIWARNRVHLLRRRPRWDVGLVVSLDHQALQEDGLANSAISATARALRAVCDFGLLDDELVAAGALEKLAVAVLAPAERWRAATIARLLRFAEEGGTVFVPGGVQVGDGDPKLAEALTGLDAADPLHAGITGVEARVAHPALERLASSLHVTRSARVGDANVRTLLAARYRPQAGGELAVFWSRPIGRGRAYVFSDFWAHSGSWLSPEPALVSLLRFAADDGAAIPQVEAQDAWAARTEEGVIALGVGPQARVAGRPLAADTIEVWEG